MQPGDVSSAAAELRPIRWSLATGVIASTLAILITIVVLQASSPDWVILIPSAALAAFLVTAIGIGMLCTILQPVKIWKGVATGLLIGILVHPVTWYLASLTFYLLGVRSSLGEPTLNPLEALWGSAVYALLSLLVVGWVTVPAGAIGGGLVAYLYRQTRR